MELRACYFCGSPGGGLDTYPVVPERVATEDAPDEPGRVVLCPDCHAKLERVLDGVLGALDAGPAESGLPPDSTESDADPSVPGAAGFSAEITFDDAPASDASDDDRNTAPDAPDGDAGTVAASDADPDRDDWGAGIDVVPDPSGASEGGDGMADAAASDGSEADAGTEGGSDDEGNGDGDDGADGADADADADESETDASGTLRGLGNSGTGQYRQALRLLQNREFPMSRADLVDVMSSAYDLSRSECDRLVDFAVDRDWLVDDDGVLRRD